MCAAKTLSLLTRLGMQLSRQGQHAAASMLLARALRETLRLRTPMAEANIHNNLSLIFQLQGRYHLARRQLARALALVEIAKSPNHRFHGLLRTNYEHVEQALRRAA